MDNVSNITAIVLLLAANGFYVAAEFALVKARGFRITSESVNKCKQDTHSQYCKHVNRTHTLNIIMPSLSI